MTALEPRLTCARCRRPLFALVPGTGSLEGASAPLVAVSGACFCDRTTLLPTRNRILLLQHPRERRVGIGTARLAHLALPRSALRVGTDFSCDPVVRAWLDEPTPAYVLFPGADARPLESLPRDRTITLVVIDGTWSQARKLLKLNPEIAGLPRVGFQPRGPSGYIIRQQPADFCVSTIEALAEALQLLEPAAGPFERLLEPFRAMVERQRWFESEVRARRHHHHHDGPRPRASGRAPVAARLRADFPRLVCVQGEANAWSRRDPDRRDPETVHWVAHRVATGDTFEAVVAPRRPLARSTPTHIELPAARLGAGTTVEAWHRAWRSFLRPDDVLLGWGTFYRNLARDDGLELALPFRDLRAEAPQVLRRRPATVDDFASALAAQPAPLGLSGRGGRRLAALVGAVRALVGSDAD